MSWTIGNWSIKQRNKTLLFEKRFHTFANHEFLRLLREAALSWFALVLLLENKEGIGIALNTDKLLTDVRLKSLSDPEVRVALLEAFKHLAEESGEFLSLSLEELQITDRLYLRSLNKVDWRMFSLQLEYLRYKNVLLLFRLQSYSLSLTKPVHFSSSLLFSIEVMNFGLWKSWPSEWTGDSLSPSRSLQVIGLPCNITFWNDAVVDTISGDTLELETVSDS